MPSILVLEQDPRSLERIHHTLEAAGWRVRIVGGPDEAFQAATSERPDLVIVGAAVSGADSVAGSFSRRAGGPGVLGLLPPGASPDGFAGLGADGLLAQPFSDQELLTAVQRAGTAPKAAMAAPARPQAESKLTSHDIFGDVLAEIDDEEPSPPAPVAPAPAPFVPAPSPAPAAAPAAPRPASRRPEDNIDSKLEQTLSGVFGSDLGRPRPAAPPAPVRPAAPPPRKPDPAGDEDIDAILSRTLGNLEMPRPKPAPPRPVPVPVAPPPVSATAPPSEGTAVRRSPRSSVSAGLSEFEELTRSLRPGAPAAPPAPRPVAPPPPVTPPEPFEPPPTQVIEAPAPVPEPLPEPPRAPAASVSPFGADPFDLTALEVPAPVELSEAPTFREPLPEPLPTPPEPDIPFDLLDLGDELEPAPEPLAPVDPVVPVVPIAPPIPEPAPVPPEPEPEPVPTGARVLDTRSDDFAATQRISMVLDDSTLDIPGAERFGQYTLLEKIAAGGMAEVWKARMRGVEGFQKTVAIKKILPHMTDNSEFIGMFIDEAKLAAQLSHPNIVHIYDLGKIGRDYYIAMEYVEGKDLRSILNASRRKEMALPTGLALLIASRLASALDYAHRKRDFEGKELGLVHRDVSPQNVLITSEGDVKLCDFGIAKAVSKAGQTQMGSLKGKLQYMSPEQAWGRPVDARSDIFSLGAVLFEMLTGERLFSGDSEMSILESVRQGRIRSVRDLAPSVPPDVDEIVSRALAYEVRDRFQSAGEMMQRIDAVLHSLSPSPGPGELAYYLERAMAPEMSDDLMFIPPGVPAPPPASPPAAPMPHFSAAEVPPSLFTPEPLPAEAAPPAIEAVAPMGEVYVEEGGGRKSRRMLLIAIIVLLLAALLFFFLLARRGGGAGEETPPAEEPAAASALAPAPALQPVSPAAAPAEMAPAETAPAAGGVDVEAILKEELAKRERELRGKYEAEQRKLERELAKAQKSSRASGEKPAPEAGDDPEPPPAEPPPRLQRD